MEWEDRMESAWLSIQTLEIFFTVEAVRTDFGKVKMQQ